MKAGTTFILSLTAIITLAAGSAFGKYSGGTGEPNDPYQISDVNDLLVLAADANDYVKFFILTADVNMEGQVFTTAIIAAGGGTAFTGTFDGNGHTIANLTIDTAGADNCYLGLFGYIGSGGYVKNLGVEGVNITGGYSSQYLGGLVGYNNYGNITDCYATGSVTGGYGSWHLGGLVGQNNGGNIIDCYATGSVSGGYNSGGSGGLVGDNYQGGSISNCYATGVVSGRDYLGGLVGGACGGSISNCYATGSVSGTGGCLGGLVGYNYQGGSISNCYATGVVSGHDDYLGGLVGYNDGGSSSISNCYSTGTVSGGGGGWVGGLVGRNNGSITNCYSTGAVSASQDVGGLLGGNYGSVISSFWDTQTSGQPTSAGGTGLTTAEMKTLLTFTSAGWNFVEIWGIGENQTYPYLRTEPAGDLNHDKKVDFEDFAILASHWLEEV